MGEGADVAASAPYAAGQEWERHMREWTDPRYASAVDMLTTMRTTAPKEPAKRCRGCFGYRFGLFLGPSGQRHFIGCPTCGESGEQPARPKRRRR